MVRLWDALCFDVRFRMGAKGGVECCLRSWSRLEVWIGPRGREQSQRKLLALDSDVRPTSVTCPVAPLGSLALRQQTLPQTL